MNSRQKNTSKSWWSKWQDKRNAEKAANYFQEGKSAFEVNFFSEAYFNLTKAIKHFSDDDADKSNAYILRAKCCLKLGLKNDFLADYDHGIQLCHDDKQKIKHYSSMGVYHINMRNYSAALAEFSKSIELNLDPNSNGLAYHNRGTTYFCQGNYDAAIEDFNKGAELQISDSHKADSYSMLAEIYKKKKNFDEAIDCQTKVIELTPKESRKLRTIAERGDIYLQKQNYLAAIDDYSAVLLLGYSYKNDLIRIYLQRSSAYEGLEDFDPAMRDLILAEKMASSHYDGDSRRFLIIIHENIAVIEAKIESKKPQPIYVKPVPVPTHFLNNKEFKNEHKPENPIKRNISPNAGLFSQPEINSEETIISSGNINSTGNINATQNINSIGNINVTENINSFVNINSIKNINSTENINFVPERKCDVRTSSYTR